MKNKFSADEANLIDLNDLKKEEINKKKTETKNVNSTSPTKEGLLYASKEELDNFVLYGTTNLNSKPPMYTNFNT